MQVGRHSQLETYHFTCVSHTLVLAYISLLFDTVRHTWSHVILIPLYYCSEYRALINHLSSTTTESAALNQSPDQINTSAEIHLVPPTTPVQDSSQELSPLQSPTGGQRCVPNYFSAAVLVSCCCVRAYIHTSTSVCPGIITHQGRF